MSKMADADTNIIIIILVTQLLFCLMNNKRHTFIKLSSV